MTDDMLVFVAALLFFGGVLGYIVLLLYLSRFGAMAMAIGSLAYILAWVVAALVFEYCVD